MKSFIETVNKWPLIVKLLLCIPVVEIFYGICRIINQVSKGNILLLVVAILTVIPGATFMWLVDLLWILFTGHACLLG